MEQSRSALSHVRGEAYMVTAKYRSLAFSLPPETSMAVEYRRNQRLGSELPLYLLMSDALNPIEYLYALISLEKAWMPLYFASRSFRMSFR